MQMVCAFVTISEAVARNYRPSFGDVQCLLPGLSGIAYQRVLKFARAQSSIGLVPPVCKSFRSNSETSFSKDIQHQRSSQAHECDVPAPATNSCCLQRSGNGLLCDDALLR